MLDENLHEGEDGLHTLTIRWSGWQAIEAIAVVGLQHRAARQARDGLRRKQALGRSQPR